MSAINLPGWVPDAARVYLAHTETGCSIRELAREKGCHASTVLRQVRKIETRRDDPLVDAALRALGTAKAADPDTAVVVPLRNLADLKPNPPGIPDEVTLRREARRVLRRMCEVGAVLAVAAEMDKAVVVRDTGEGGAARTAVVDAPIAEAMALQDWIACDAPGRISRYRITQAGRSALSHMVAEQENRIRGMADTQINAETGREAEAALDEADRDPRARKGRYMLAESPLTVLSRRSNKDGSRFLTGALVTAGERLREDFELAQLAQGDVSNWDQIMGGQGAGPVPEELRGSEAAGWRLRSALRDLGPGLGDVALQCCCYLEGLEVTEKRLGWSARSGKIVLRIALQRLRRHYEDLAAQGGDLVG